MIKPVFLIGAGCPAWLADKLALLNVPILTTWQGIDRIPEDSPVFCGRPGVIGQRAANVIQQKSNWLMIVGARLDMEQVGYRLDNFAPNAQKTIVDIDPAELAKYPDTWNKYIGDLNNPENWPRGFPLISGNPEWLKWCKDLYNHFRPELDGEDKIEDYVDPYYFTRVLSDVCEKGEIIVPASSGMQSCALMQAFKVKRDQKILLCNTTGAMGFEPMAIGAALATNKRVICVCGDGGFFMNVQELEVVKRLNLNIKYFVFCNGGYGSISSMQDARFNKRVGADAQSGFTLPDLQRIAISYNIGFLDIRNNETAERIIKMALYLESPTIIRVNTTLAFRYVSKVNSGLKDGVFEADDMADMSPKIDNLQELMND